jgi:2'-5' RNA ligase
MANIERQVDEEDWASFQHVERLTDHWSRHDWPPDRHFVTWYVLFDDPRLVDFVASFQRQLADLTYLDPVPPDALHMTIQGVAYADELGDQQIQAIADRARCRCEGLTGFELHLGPLSGFQAGTFLRAGPWAPVEELRQRLRAAITDVLGPDVLPAKEPRFKPHISVTYCHADPPADELTDRVSRLRSAEQISTGIHAVDLLDLYRQGRTYRWTTLAQIRLDQH